MKNSTELFSYAIVVIESLWPKLPDEAPKLVGKPSGDPASNAYLYSETQNAFSGYFKIIPLNIKSVSVNNSKDGHTFNISFDPSYVYVQLNPKYIPKGVYSYIVKNSFQYTQSGDLNFLSGILEGFSKSQYENSEFESTEHYFVPGNVISKFVNEMDTVSIFLIQDLNIFDNPTLIKLSGGSFSRMRESDKLSGTKELLKLGIIKPDADIEALQLITLGEKLVALRQLMSNKSIGIFSYALDDDTKIGFLPGLKGADAYANSANMSTAAKNVSVAGPVFYLDKTTSRFKEKLILDQIINFYKTGDTAGSCTNVSDCLDYLGPIIADYVYNLLNNAPETSADVNNASRSDLNSAKIQVLSNFQSDLIAYYNNSNTTASSENGVDYSDKLSYSLSWATWRTIYYALAPYIEIQDPEEKRNTIKRIAKTMMLELYVAKYAKTLHSDILFDLSNNRYKKSGEIVSSYKNNTNPDQTLFGKLKNFVLAIVERFSTDAQYGGRGAAEHIFRIDPKSSPETAAEGVVKAYFEGLDTFFKHVVEPLIKKDEKSFSEDRISPESFLSNNSENLKMTLEGLDDLKYPPSCETPYFVLNGHVSKISDSSEVSSGDYRRSMSISGVGFEAPLQNHYIYIDQFNTKQSAIYSPALNFSISVTTPINAALTVLAIHMPDYVEYFEGNITYKDSLKIDRNFQLFKKGVGKFVEKGHILAKRPTTSVGPSSSMSDSADNFFILAPVHYVDKSYLRMIKSVFDTTLIYADQVVAEQRSISDGSVYDALQSFLPNSSMYSFYIDEFGTIKIRYEISAAAQTSSTILSPIVTDKELMTLNVASDQSKMYNLVEIMPKPFVSTPEAGASQVYSRATAPDVVEAYSLYKELSVYELLNSSGAAKDNFFNFLKGVYGKFLQATKEVVEDYNKTYGGKNFISSKNDDGTVNYNKYAILNPETDVVRDPPLTFDQLYTWLKPGSTPPGQKLKPETQQTVTSSTTSTTAKSSSSASGDTEEFCAPAQVSAAVGTTKVQSTATQKQEPIAQKIAKYNFLYARNGNAGESTAMYIAILDLQDYPSVVDSASVIPVRFQYALNTYTLSDDFIQQKYTELLVDPQKAGPEVKAAAAQTLKSFGYIDYIKFSIRSKLNSMYPGYTAQSGSGITYLRDISEESLDMLVNVLCTLAFFGISDKEIQDYIKSQNSITVENTISNYLSWMFNNLNLFYIPATLSELNTKPKNISSYFIKEKESRRLPYYNYGIQDLHPSTVAVEYFRYGLRRLQLDDFYAANRSLTDFRAEAVRKMYEYPMLTASISILMNPMYKVGNTVLVVSEHFPNNKGTYINKGLKEIFEDSTKPAIESSPGSTNTDPRPYNLIARVDDLVISKQVTITSNSLYQALTGISLPRQITEIDVLKHFSSAFSFLMDPKNNPKMLPVPSDAYVPLLGIYQTKSEPVKKYLQALLQFYIYVKEDNSSLNYLDRTGPNGYTKLYQNVEDAIIEIYKSISYGEEFNPQKFDHLNNLLRPQNYHVYQYHINNISHSWSFGRNAVTSLSGNFGIPAIMCYLPSNNSQQFDMHILGYTLTRGPNFYTNEYGGLNKKLKKDHVAYRFSIGQQKAEEKFYKSKYRYDMARILERIRRKYWMPQLYGGNLFKVEVSNAGVGNETPINQSATPILTQ